MPNLKNSWLCFTVSYFYIYLLFYTWCSHKFLYIPSCSTNSSCIHSCTILQSSSTIRRSRCL